MCIELDFWFCSRCVEPVSQVLGDVVRPAIFCELMKMGNKEIFPSLAY